MMSAASSPRFEKVMTTFASSGDIQAEFLVFWKLPPGVVYEMGIHHLPKNDLVINEQDHFTTGPRGKSLLVVVVVHERLVLRQQESLLGEVHLFVGVATLVRTICRDDGVTHLGKKAGQVDFKKLQGEISVQNL